MNRTNDHPSTINNQQSTDCGPANLEPVNLPTFQPSNLSTFKQLDYDHDYDDDHDYDHDYELRLRARTINHQPSTHFVFFVPGMLKVSKRVYTDRAAEENGVCHEA